jgi:hypothetical protein
LRMTFSPMFCSLSSPQVCVRMLNFINKLFSKIRMLRAKINHSNQGNQISWLTAKNVSGKLFYRILPSQTLHLFVIFNNEHR